MLYLFAVRLSRHVTFVCMCVFAYEDVDNDNDNTTTTTATKSNNNDIVIMIVDITICCPPRVCMQSLVHFGGTINKM